MKIQVGFAPGEHSQKTFSNQFTCQTKHEEIEATNFWNLGVGFSPWPNTNSETGTDRGSAKKRTLVVDQGSRGVRILW
jgi:hypothetical protein